MGLTSNMSREKNVATTCTHGKVVGGKKLNMLGATRIIWLKEENAGRK